MIPIRPSYRARTSNLFGKRLPLYQIEYHLNGVLTHIAVAALESFSRAEASP